jgi:O-antigen ligase
MRDLLALIVRFFFEEALPYLVGRLVVTSSRDARTLVRTFVGLGLVYSLFMLIEIRLSPYLHNWVYGYACHDDFLQTRRWGGYRPNVFLVHGLAVGLFALATALFAATEGRITRRRLGLPTSWWTLYLVAVLVLCRSTGAIIMGLVTLPFVALASPRRQIRVAVLLAAVCIAYFGVKLAGVFPDQTIVDFTRDHLSADRAGSLQFRFDSDKTLIEHARERLWFGWGEFGRNRVYDDTGRDTVTTDGYWIIVLCGGGLLRLACTFGLLLYPVMRAARVLKRVREPADRFLLAGLAVVLACYVFDLLPNGMGHPFPLFLAGALARLNLELSRPEMAEPQRAAGAEAAFRFSA